MSHNKENNIDGLFRQGLLNEEQVFSQNAWEKMRRKLDEDDTIIVPVATTNRKKKNKYTIMSIATIITASALLMLGQREEKLNTVSNIAETGKQASAVKPAKSADSEKVSEGRNAGGEFSAYPYPTEQKGQIKQNQTVFQKAEDEPEAHTALGAGLTEDAAQIKGEKEEEKTAEPAKGVKSGLKKAADSTAKPAVKKSDYTFRDGFVGLHFTWQEALTPALQDSNRYNAGFNVQFMSRNLLKASPFGGYLGLDWGMQFYGKGNKTNVQLNTNNGDSGWTRLSTFSMDFFARGHLEYARHKLIPYVNFFAGPRFYSTNQKVQSYIPLANSESSDLINAATAVSFMTGVGAGMRWRISDAVSLDARFDWMNGSGTKLVDLDKSTFNGLNYNLVKRNVSPEYYQLKFGVLFNLGDDENYEPTRTTYNTYREPQYIYTQPTYQYFDSSSNTWKDLPMCPCNCDSTGKKISPNNIRRTYPAPPVKQQGDSNRGWEPQPEIRGSGSGTSPRQSGGSGSSPIPTGKGAFPGIKPNGSGGKIKS